MTDPQFISPTMSWIYDKQPDWTSDRDTLYKMGYSRRTMRDVRGYDIYGFNEAGLDRMGCSRKDYDDPFVAAIGRTCDEWMSLSAKLPFPLPRFLELKQGFETYCRSRWDVVDEWSHDYRSLPKDGRCRLFTQMGGDFSLGLHWFDQLDGKDNFVLIRTDSIALLEADPDDIPFRIVSMSSSTEPAFSEDVVCAPSAAVAIEKFDAYVNEHFEGQHAWTIYLVDGTDGPYLAAYSASEKAEADGDLFGLPIRATSREAALRGIMDNAKTTIVSEMASAGLEHVQPRLDTGAAFRP